MKYRVAQRDDQQFVVYEMGTNRVLASFARFVAAQCFMRGMNRSASLGKWVPQ